MKNMKTYEYTILRLGADDVYQRSVESLNKLGAEGWEVASSVAEAYQNGEFRAIIHTLKRESSRKPKARQVVEHPREK